MDIKYGRYMNLKAELARKGVTQTQVAESLGMSLKNLNMKINGKVAFTVPEMVAIHDTFAPDATIDYLVATDMIQDEEPVPGTTE